MIKLQIGSSGWYRLNDVSEGWVNEQINRRRAAGYTVCVQVRLENDHIRMTLATAGCNGGGGGGRLPNAKEKEIFALWKDRGLNESNFTGGQLVAFLKQLERMC